MSIRSSGSCIPETSLRVKEPRRRLAEGRLLLNIFRTAKRENSAYPNTAEAIDPNRLLESMTFHEERRKQSKTRGTD